MCGEVTTRLEHWIGILTLAGSVVGLNLGQIFTGLDLLTPGICTALGAAAGTAVYAAKQSQSGDDSDADRVDATLLPFALEGNRSKFHACTQAG